MHDGHCVTQSVVFGFSNKCKNMFLVLGTYHLLLFSRSLLLQFYVMKKLQSVYPKSFEKNQTVKYQEQ